MTYKTCLKKNIQTKGNTKIMDSSFPSVESLLLKLSWSTRLWFNRQESCADTPCIVCIGTWRCRPCIRIYMIRVLAFLHRWCAVGRYSHVYVYISLFLPLAKYKLSWKIELTISLGFACLASALYSFLIRSCMLLKQITTDFPSPFHLAFPLPGQT